MAGQGVEFVTFSPRMSEFLEKKNEKGAGVIFVKIFLSHRRMF